MVSELPLYWCRVLSEMGRRMSNLVIPHVGIIASEGEQSEAHLRLADTTELACCCSA